MDPRIYSQHTIWAAVASFLMAVVLFQVAGSLECYSCIEEGDNGCSPANITIVQCVLPMNICIEYMQTVGTGSFMVTRRKKGCSLGLEVGIAGNTTNEAMYHISNIQGCSTNLCNNKLPNSTVTIPPHSTMVPNGVECYSCASFSRDRCLPEKIKCTGDMTRCYEGNVTIAVNDGNPPKAIYFKTCEDKSICTTDVSLSATDMTISQKGFCCSGSYCNGPALPTTGITTTSNPNSQVPCSSVSYFSLLIGILIVIGVL
ncbi:ly6/PLAUR domain-containing protein 3 isoform X2 [Microcaecilia unicolor]|uniref:Ly6/PLAUR domain-containing protein 3-like isoform X2 n=1 Tax=Microcaecilia unicolor TaxID=1415580 RepID=A0A6P7YQY0_9AMPH|nr:ly6/PLAUR domain-containing protein 3-like isoform X2 [Microcaecilia unicolor]XP_030067372.1 ly6/PLAUR domain-containing protein 3-like isoform X2 [Microcaecilia unicolor]XP_030067373.1 ly6/PLAUR domain-containing protein 3-like isoform X2 [Microcaecilia unicolor]XP_030067374.1 ly6/PLAUR domain-containing protein 3-like isoform X2 [Microcaecilia unicolor]